MNAPLPLPRTPWRPQKMHWWYDAIADLMITRPDITKAEIARQLGRTPQTIYMVTASDAFQAVYSRRRAEMSGHLDDSVKHRLLSVADKSLGLINDVIEKKRESIPLPQLVDLSDKVLDRLGYGIKPDQSTSSHPPVQVTVNAPSNVVAVPVSAHDLAAARAALRRSEELKMIDVKSEAERTFSREGGLQGLPSPALEDSDPSGSEGTGI